MATLPAAPKPRSARRQTITEGDSPFTLSDTSTEFSGAKILVAEDSNSDRLLLKTMLLGYGFEVATASDGREAVDMFQQQRPDLVLLDALMPVMDGFEAASLIRAAAGEEFVPIIFLTSLEDPDSLARCLEVGGNDFLTKPYQGVILQATLNVFLRMREMQRTLTRQRDEIANYNELLLREQSIAKRVFDKVAHVGCLDAPNIQYAISPIAIFNGDVALAGVSPSGNLFVLLGDFTGHGLNAAIGAMPLAQSFYGMLSKGFALRDILVEINEKLYDVLPVEIFCCALVAEIDFNNNALTVWNGGLPDAVLSREGGMAMTRIESKSLPFGVRPTIDLRETIEVLEVLPGDRLYIWSDGIHEAASHTGELYGEQRLMKLFEANSDPRTRFKDIIMAVNAFIGAEEAADDISLIEVEIVAPEQFKVAVPASAAGAEVGLQDWSLNFELRTGTLKEFDPLPLLLHVLMQVPFLRPNSGQIYTAMTELYTNALEHGVLGLDSALKNSPAGFGNYYQQRKQALDTLQQGSIRVGLDYKGVAAGGRLEVTMEDSGPGFDLSAVNHFIKHGQHTADGRTSANATYAGRGIHLLKSLCHSLEFSGQGNCVKAVFDWDMDTNS